MTLEVHVPEETFAAVRAVLDARNLVELAATIGACNMVSRFIGALGIDSRDALSATAEDVHPQP